MANKSKLKTVASEEPLVLWRRPITTVEYFAKEMAIKTSGGFQRALAHRGLLAAGVIALLGIWAAGRADGVHRPVVESAKRFSLWALYWLGLGVLSSIGLGTGLHTFLLYLGPHIAAVTLAAYECGGLNFPEPPYPDQILCPEQVSQSWSVSVWNIIRKVHVECIMWGAGTALGELPPYFMARAARLSGRTSDEDDDAMKELTQLRREAPERLGLVDRAKLAVEDLVNRAGFIGILLCASIPNPLFDLAGITCGHFLVPFWTFFGATLVGKAIVKMSMQAVFVIVAFSEVLVGRITKSLGSMPLIGSRLESLLRTALDAQRSRLRSGSSNAAAAAFNPIGAVFETLVVTMVAYFVVSIINSLAQSYQKRLTKRAAEPPSSTN